MTWLVFTEVQDVAYWLMGWMTFAFSFSFVAMSWNLPSAQDIDLRHAKHANN